MAEEKTATEEKGAPAGARSAGCFFCGAFVPFLERCWSDATKEHFRSSRVEFLKGVRSMLDDRIARLSRKERHGSHVTVE
jgi:hypothetical protein